MRINIAGPNPDYYGDCVEFDELTGDLSINMYDGMTKLNKDEAKQLVEALNKFIKELDKT